MAKLEDIVQGVLVQGVSPDGLVEVVAAKRLGESAVELTYKVPGTGLVDNRLLYRNDEPDLAVIERGSRWSFRGDGQSFRLVSEARRIQLAHLFDPVLAVHTSDVRPLPHQITAVYDSMLTRQPLRFLLADDPGAGKTIMAGLLIKELKARGSLERCLVVCPGSLAEQWQDELYRRFRLPFDIMTNDKLEASRTGNWFSETPLAIARMDKLARDEDSQALLMDHDGGWDLIICDEAHKMSASFFGGEVKYTKRYRLGQMLSALAHHFLLLTATPHNGKEEDFQLFMALLDADRFEGRFRDGVHTADVSDLMRRMVKENLFKLDATPLFPERRAYAVPYKLSDGEDRLYQRVTDYVRREFNRAEALQNDNRARNVGFALTILQRRLASSPEAIYQSLGRRKEKLKTRLDELQSPRPGSQRAMSIPDEYPELDDQDIDDLEDAPDEISADDEEILVRATAARTASELEAEIESLRELESLARDVRNGGKDRKWKELAELLRNMFTESSEDTTKQYRPSPDQKIVIFTEHRATLDYLLQKITTLLGQEEAVVVIHGGVKREDRRLIQESFMRDPEVRILLANDAASEGINLQRAHLMVNYDLPWNPNRIEQRFGRIHRIGQTEVCHLWNLIAEGTREGDVYHTLLKKLEEARRSLGGQVFDVLGRVQFEGKPLRELLVEAIRHGEKLEVRARLDRVVKDAFDRKHVQDLLEESALARESMDTSEIHKISERMERAEARKLQPHYIQSFFAEAFGRLGGRMAEREPKRYQVMHVPAKVRERGRLICMGEPVLQRYERIVFEKSLRDPVGRPLADFVCPGHPLLDAVTDLTLEQHRGVFQQGALLVDERDYGDRPRALIYLEHRIQDESRTHSGQRRIVSTRMHYVELSAGSEAIGKDHAPYLDYRPLRDDEPGVQEIVGRPECGWVGNDLEDKAVKFFVSELAPKHLDEIKSQKEEHLDRTEAAVRERLTKEIAYWDSRTQELKEQERDGKPNARLNSAEAGRRADELQARLDKRMDEIGRERKLSPLPPVVVGGVLVVPAGLLRKIAGASGPGGLAGDTQEAAARARRAVMEAERRLGYEPTDRESDKVGYDIESSVPGTGRLRFIEVKGRVQGAATITVTKNEILTSLNKPEDYILAIVEFHGEDHRVYYVREPFAREPDFGVTSVNYNMAELLARGKEPS